MRRLATVAALAFAAAVAGCGGGSGGSGEHDTAAARSRAQATAPATGGRPVARTARARPVAIGSGSPRGRRVALTFDADMTPEMLDLLRAGRAPAQVNREVIDTLRATRTPAALFVTGMWAQLYPAEVRDLARDPLFEIGNHTWDHRAWSAECYGLPSTRDPGGKRAEVVRTARILRGLTGRAPFWFRFPGLCHGQLGLRIVAGEGEQAVDGLASGDAYQSDPAAIVRRVLSAVRPGAIVVMHMMGPPNAPATGEALRQLIPDLRGRGYQLVSLSRLLRGP